MSKEMLINAIDTEECRIAVMDGGELQELYVERAGGSHHVGNIYKGRVTNIEPGIQAAFIDYGPPKNGFLHVSDIVPGYFPDHAKAHGGRKPPIQTILKRNQELVLQVTKEGIGTKGATLSTYLSLAGRYLVLMPGFQRVGVSRKIEDDAERRKLRELLEGLERPKNMGVIVRTAGLNQSKSELQRDLRYLMRVWAMVSEQIKASSCPSEIFRESDLVVRTIRDIFTTDIKRITVDHPEVTRRVRDFLRVTMPRYHNRVHAYEGKVPLFHKFGIEEELEKIYARTVPLPSGGYLVVEQTEALVSIDVNSGKFRSESNPEEAAFKLNLEAAKEIVRQLRLRDLGGVIVMDFVDMRSDKHRRSVEDVLRQELKKDRARSKFLRTSRFGLIEMTRQRMRPSLERASFMECPHCKGSGLIKSPESMSLEVMRLLSLAASQDDIHQIEVTVHPTVGHYINNRKRRTLVELEEHTGKQIMVIADSDVSQETADFHCQDSRGVPVKFDARRLARQQRERVLDKQKREKAAEAPQGEKAAEAPQGEKAAEAPQGEKATEAPQGEKAAEAPQGEKARKDRPRRKRRRKKAVPTSPAVTTGDTTAVPDKPKGPEATAQAPKKKSSRRRRRKKSAKAAGAAEAQGADP